MPPRFTLCLRLFVGASLLATLPALASDLSRASSLPQVYSLSAANLAAARARLDRGDPELTLALGRLREEADRALQMKPVSVMDKTRTPPSGDKHDYLSQAPYWWPDPAKPDGLPYLRRDGEHNPEIDRGTDHGPMGRMAEAVNTLALAFFSPGTSPTPRTRPASCASGSSIRPRA